MNQPIQHPHLLPCKTEAIHAIDLPYRITSGALDAAENTSQWVDNGIVRAWAIFQPVFWTIDIGGDETLIPQVLEWAEQRIPHLGRPCWFVEALDKDTSRQVLLADAGYVPQTEVPVNPWFKARMVYRGKTLSVAPPPRGITIRPLHGMKEVEAYVALHRAVFQTESMTVPWRQATLQHPAYHPELDLVAHTSEGELVGFCIGWLSGDYGLLEPLGIHESHRHQGIATALTTELLNRMWTLGAKQCFVEPDAETKSPVGFYQSVGFEIEQYIHLFRKGELPS